MLQIVHRVISGFLIKQAGLKRTQADTGAVTLIQRFGSAANLNIHLHCLVLDGVYCTAGGVPVFHPVRAPTTEQLQALLTRIIKRLMRLLARQGYLVEEQGMTYLGDTDPEATLAPLQAAACTYRIAFGPRAGQKVLTLQTLPSQAARRSRRRALARWWRRGMRCWSRRGPGSARVCAILAMRMGYLPSTKTTDRPSVSCWSAQRGKNLMVPLDLVKLTALMERTSGSLDVKIGLIDGPVVTQHPDLAGEHLREIPGNNGATCTQANSTACLHGTFVAGILSAKRNSSAPAICPNCTLVIRPIFAEATLGREHMPSATPKELAAAIIECINIGARVINLSLALAQPSPKGEQALEEAFNQAVKRSVIVVAAAGNQGTLGSSAITRHPWVISVVACDLRGRPMNESNLGSSIGRRGLSAPGDAITSLGAEGQSLTLGGTSVAAPFVTGTIALLWSEFPSATAAQIKLAITQASTPRRASVVPPLLDAAAAYQILLTTNARR